MADDGHGPKPARPAYDADGELPRASLRDRASRQGFNRAARTHKTGPAATPDDYRNLDVDLATACAGLTRSVTVLSGDTLGKIAKRHRTQWRLIARLNAADPRQIRPGQKLEVLAGRPHATVDLAALKLTVFVDERAVREYPIGIGAAESKTPAGEFIVQRKAVNPSWNYQGQYAAPGDPDNPVGTRWLGLGGGYGIHGTNEPDSIGQRGSLGCIRLLNEHVEEVYDLLPAGAKVVVK